MAGAGAGVYLFFFFLIEFCFRVRVSVFPLPCNFYVPGVNFTRVNKIKARYKLSSLNVKLSEVRTFTFILRSTFYTLPLFHVYAKVNFTHVPT